jgi:hypothetical protein
MLNLRSVDICDDPALEGRQRIGRCFARSACRRVWLWNVTIHLTGLPMGSSSDINAARAEFTAAWEGLKARTRWSKSRLRTRQ